jgi:hypothetical protein
VSVEWTASGEVITYKSERADRWCREGWAISNDYGRFVDTYWMSTGDAHVLTEAELATAEHAFWIDDYRELDRYGRGVADEWAKYAPADRRYIPSQHGLQCRYFVRREASFDLPTQIQNASDALDAADSDLHAARRRRQYAEDRLRELQSALDANEATR